MRSARRGFVGVRGRRFGHALGQAREHFEDSCQIDMSEDPPETGAVGDQAESAVPC
ncbi:hypothetical protein SBD_0588 [Streptomyces bottropensis ATCC 25435]|uniref:Uncharacterized protein n=1 Tax=Streptomyces bottropensis ATCC 25435 TaxID=1054862 RepID=M3EN48_9ACTN|nr:hypothetical protein SBD_0588 [Streptomyces bottropensis ATCC 25435]